MRFLFFALAGLCGGVLGGMGMGGGTLLIPLLSLVLGVEQHTAQAINLVAFIPLSVISLIIHAKNGYLKTKSVLTVVLSGVPSCLFGAFLASEISSDVLKRCFGGFLILLSVFCFYSTLKAFGKQNDFVQFNHIVKISHFAKRLVFFSRIYVFFFLCGVKNAHYNL